MIRPWSLLAVILAILVAGCANRTIESAHFGPPSAIESAIRQYYARNATENAGRCRRPYVSTINAVEVLEDSPEQLVVNVRYTYGDRIVRRDESGAPNCFDFVGRTFTVVDTATGPEVVEMSEAWR